MLRFVPPFAIGKTPLTCVVNPTLPYDGTTPTPPLINTLPVATSGTLANVVEVPAVIISPTVYELKPVPPFTAIRVPDRVTALVVAELGVNPVVPADHDVTATEDKSVGVYVPPPFPNNI